MPYEQDSGGTSYSGYYSAAGSLAQLYASYEQGKTRKIIADYNARAGARRAERILEETRKKEEAFRKYARAFLGKQQVNFAVAGVDAGSGSARDVMNETMIETELDALAIRFSGQNEALDVQNQAIFDALEGKLAMRQARSRMGTYLLKANKDAYDQYYQNRYGTGEDTGSGF